MARKATRRVRRKARSTRKRKWRGPSPSYKANLTKTGLGFPKKMTMTHKYVESFIAWGSTAGSLFTYNISCNDIYDPNQTGTGHQPYYYDTMAALYNHWTVIGSKIKFTCTPISQNATPTFLGVFVNDSTAVTPSSIDSLAEFGNPYKVMSVGATDPTYLNSKWSAKKSYGGAVLNNSLLRGGSAGTSPSEQQYYTFFTQAAGATQSQSLAVTVEIEYIVVWTELKDIIGS